MKTAGNTVTETVPATIGYVLRHALCDGQESMGDLGYSPLPMNLVLAALEQTQKIPGIDADTNGRINAIREGTLSGGANPCNNPTFKPGDSPSHNVLVDTAPFPAGCDEGCQAPWRKAGAGLNSGPNYGGGNDQQTTGGPGGNTGGPGGGAKAANTAGSATEVCDPDTGLCGTLDAMDDTAGGSAKAVPAVIPGHLGWTNAQNLMMLAGLLSLGLVIAPPLVSRIARRHR